MSDLSALSDADLTALLQQQQAAPASKPPADMSNDELMTALRGSAVTPDNVVRSLAGGIPILGGLADKGNAAINALGAPYAPSVFGNLPEATFGERYQHALSAEQGLDQSFHASHPAIDTGAQIAGGVASTIPLAATATGAKLLGLTGSLPGMMARGAASNAIISGADAAVRGGDIASSAGIGGLVGAGAPVIGRAVGAALSPVINTYRGIVNPEAEAARRVASAIQRDTSAGSAGFTQPEWTAAQQSGAPVNLMDRGGEVTRALARSAANTSPEGRDILGRTISDRFETQGDRLTSFLNSTFHYPDAAAQRAALEETARTANNAAYATARREGADGLWSPTLERLAGSKTVADAMRTAADAAGDEAIVSGAGAMNPRVTFDNGVMKFGRGPNGMPTYPDLQFWDLTRRELSSQAQVATRAGNDTLARRLGSFATSINAELDRMVPSYQQARQGAAQAFGAQNALEAGQNFVTSRMANDEARQALQAMSPNERQLFSDGFVSTLIQKIREYPDRRSIGNALANSAADRARLEIAVGRDRARQIEAALHVESIMDLARPAVQGNSTTARQLAELGLAGGAYAIGSGGNILSPDPASIMNAALVYGAARGRHVIDARVSRQVAELLAGNHLGRFAGGLRQLSSSPQLFGAIRQTDAALASIAARGAQPALSPAQQPQRPQVSPAQVALLRSLVSARQQQGAR